MTMRKRWLIPFMLFLVTLLFQKVVGQEDLPSLEKTIEWLRPKAINSIVVNPQILGKKSSRQQIIEWTLDYPSRCVLALKGRASGEKVGRGTAMPISVEFNLADFDPQRFNLGSFTFSDGKSTETSWTVTLHTTDNKSLINWHSSGGDFAAPSISFRFNDEDLADGVVRAFQHAINLCGGKTNPDKPDPFIRKKEKPSIRRF